MSLKSIEMQFAFHKNDEAGMKQNQLMQKPIQDQVLLSDAAEKSTEKERRISSKTEAAKQASIKDDDNSRNSKQGPGNHRKNRSLQTDNQQHHSSDHPFKGHHIDLSL